MVKKYGIIKRMRAANQSVFKVQNRQDEERKKKKKKKKPIL